MTLPDDPAQSPAKKAWEESARDWRLEGKPHSFFTDFVKTRRQELGHDALDAGCGNGIYLIPLAQNGFTVTGVDFSPPMLEAAKNNIAATGLTDKIRLEEAETKQLPYADESFDFVIMLGVLHFNNWEDIQSSFAEASRVLRPGQVLMLNARSVNDDDRPRDNIAETPAGFIKADKGGRLKGVALHYFTDKGLIELGKQHGLEVLSGPVEDTPQEGEGARPKQKRWWVAYRKLGTPAL